MTPAVEELWAEFQNLTPHQKRVVFEMYWNGYTEEETAETMGVSRPTVSRAIASAKSTIEKRLSPVIQKSTVVAVVHVEAENEGAEHGNGLVPTKANKAPVRSGPPASACPPPDIYYGSPARDSFVKALSFCAASLFLQLQGRGNYNAKAKANRERIASDL